MIHSVGIIRCAKDPILDRGRIINLSHFDGEIKDAIPRIFDGVICRICSHTFINRQGNGIWRSRDDRRTDDRCSQTFRNCIRGGVQEQGVVYRGHCGMSKCYGDGCGIGRTNFDGV